MTYKGHVENGVIVLDTPDVLPEGVSVNIRVELEETLQEPEKTSPFYEGIKEFIGIFDDLPPDFAANHDHYIHGTEKRI